MARRFNTDNELETYIAGEYSRIITELKGTRSVEILLYLPAEDDEYDDMYNEDAGHDNEDESIQLTVLFQIDAWGTLGFEDAGTFESGHIYSDAEEIESGAHFRIIRTVPDETNTTINVTELSAKYEIGEKISVGKTRTVESKWKVKSLP